MEWMFLLEWATVLTPIVCLILTAVFLWRYLDARKRVKSEPSDKNVTDKQFNAGCLFSALVMLGISLLFLVLVIHAVSPPSAP